MKNLNLMFLVVFVDLNGAWKVFIFFCELLSKFLKFRQDLSQMHVFKLPAQKTLPKTPQNHNFVEISKKKYIKLKIYIKKLPAGKY